MKSVLRGQVIEAPVLAGIVLVAGGNEVYSQTYLRRPNLGQLSFGLIITLDQVRATVQSAAPGANYVLFFGVPQTPEIYEEARKEIRSRWLEVKANDRAWEVAFGCHWSDGLDAHHTSRRSLVGFSSPRHAKLV